VPTFLNNDRENLKENVHSNKIKTNMKAYRICTKSSKFHSPRAIPYFFFARQSCRDVQLSHNLFLLEFTPYSFNVLSSSHRRQEDFNCSNKGIGQWTKKQGKKKTSPS